MGGGDRATVALFAENHFGQRRKGASSFGLSLRFGAHQSSSASCSRARLAPSGRRVLPRERERDRRATSRIADGGGFEGRNPSRLGSPTRDRATALPPSNKRPTARPDTRGYVYARIRTLGPARNKEGRKERGRRGQGARPYVTRVQVPVYSPSSPPFPRPLPLRSSRVRADVVCSPQRFLSVPFSIFLLLFPFFCPPLPAAASSLLRS